MAYFLSGLKLGCYDSKELMLKIYQKWRRIRLGWCYLSNILLSQDG